MIKVYAMDAQRKKGLFSLWPEMIAELSNSRELAWRIFFRDFMARYKQTALGILWVIIMPVAMTMVFVSLHKAGVITYKGTAIPYPLFIFLGISLWQLFSAGITVASNSLAQAGPMIVKVNFPKEVLVLAAFGQAVVDFLVRMAVMAILMVIYKAPVSLQTLLFPVTLVPIFIFTLGLCFIFSLLGVLMRDIGNGVNLITAFLLFLTPVLYTVPPGGLLADLVRWNPLSALIIIPRDTFFSLGIDWSLEYAVAILFSVFIFVIGWYLFHAVEPKIAERI